MAEFDARGLVEFVAVGDAGGHEGGWGDERGYVGGTGSVVDCESFEGFVVGFEGVDSQLTHHCVVTGSHLKIGQVAEAVGFVDGADGLDGVVLGIVFEASEEVGCCDAGVASVAVVDMVSERFV